MGVEPTEIGNVLIVAKKTAKITAKLERWSVVKDFTVNVAVVPER
jgi:hypothetical protein